VHSDTVQEDDNADTARFPFCTLADVAAGLAMSASTLLLSTWAALPALAFVEVTTCIPPEGQYVDGRLYMTYEMRGDCGTIIDAPWTWS